MTFLEYLEECGIDTEKEEFVEKTDNPLNIKTAIDLSLKDLLSLHSSFYNDLVRQGYEFDFTQSVSIPQDSENKPQSLKTLIQNYKGDISLWKNNY